MRRLRMKAKTRPVCFARSGDDDAVRTRNIWDLLSTRMGCGARESSRVEAGYRRVAFAEGGSPPRSAGDPVDERTNERTNASSSSWEMDLEDTKDDGEENIYID